MTKLVPTDRTTSERLSQEDEPVELGQWFWVKEPDDKKRWLGCAYRLGSNFVELAAVGGGTTRVHLDVFHDVCERALDADAHIQARIAEQTRRVNELMDDIRRVTARLGVVDRPNLGEGGETTSALAVASGTADVKAHKAALIKAKDEELPALFKQVTEAHEKMAMWMKAQLRPHQAQLEKMQTVTKTIEGRIFTVELYAGLTEELALIADGEPAANDAKVHLMQRRHYMDEECLANYEAGGMEFKDIREFDAWVTRADNRARILPHPRTVVAFQVRRKDKERHHSGSYGDHIRIHDLERADKATFLYIRNGDRIFRLDTSIDFGERLFPDREHDSLLDGGNLWIRMWGSNHFRGTASQREYDAEVQKRKEEAETYKHEVAAWKRGGRKGQKPWKSGGIEDDFFPADTRHVYYDDAMSQVQAAAAEHNRVAIVLQGLLDRSMAFHPHPPWQLWTAEGFMSAIELSYDDSRALVPGDAPDFEAYRGALNASLKRGCYTVGQYQLWLRAEAKKEGDRRNRSWRARSNYDLEFYHPYGNPGPGKVAIVTSLSRGGGAAEFSWTRARSEPKWVPNPDKPGYLKATYPRIPCHFRCPVSRLLNVSAYTPGDFRRFYADPRTRADYVEWAPLLLAAEDFHHRRENGEPPTSQDDEED